MFAAEFDKAGHVFIFFRLIMSLRVYHIAKDTFSPDCDKIDSTQQWPIYIKH